MNLPPNYFPFTEVKKNVGCGRPLASCVWWFSLLKTGQPDSSSRKTLIKHSSLFSVHNKSFYVISSIEQFTLWKNIRILILAHTSKYCIQCSVTAPSPRNTRGQRRLKHTGYLSLLLCKQTNISTQLCLFRVKNGLRHEANTQHIQSISTRYNSFQWIIGRTGFSIYLIKNPRSRVAVKPECFCLFCCLGVCCPRNQAADSAVFCWKIHEGPCFNEIPGDTLWFLTRQSKVSAKSIEFGIKTVLFTLCRLREIRIFLCRKKHHWDAWYCLHKCSGTS